MMETTVLDYQPWMTFGLALVLFLIGLFGVIVRKNLLVILMCIELMLCSVNMIFVTFSKINGSIDGQVFVLFTMTVAAAESALGLGLIISLYRTLKTVNTDKLTALRD